MKQLNSESTQKPNRDFTGRPIDNIPKPKIYGRDNLIDRARRTIENIKKK